MSHRRTWLWTEPVGTVSFDPASLSATAYLKDFASAPWNGTASAGTSGSHNFIAGTAPTAGASFGSHSSARFNGTTQELIGDSITFADLISASAFTMQFIVEFTSAVAPVANYLDPSLIGDTANGDFFVSYTTAGVSAGFNIGVYPYYVNTTSVPLATGVKVCIQVTLSGGTLTCNVRGVGSQSTSIADFAGLARIPHLCNTYGGAKPAVDIAHFMAFATALSSGDRDALYADAQANYGVL